METNLSVLVPRVNKLSQKFDNISLIQSHHWVLVDEMKDNKNLFIFRNNNELIISDDGCVDIAKWRYLGKNTLTIERGGESTLYKKGFFDENLIAIKIHNDDEYSFFVNETKFDLGLNSKENIERYLHKKYIHNIIKNRVTRRRRKSYRNKKIAVFIITISIIIMNIM